ncbi:MAG: 2OG-Fe(II) oxygenase [Gammaproteobacteria bacterium]|nr:2OG-Fe(II) oxygenase [Gammaproteobacteria bacterium]
MSNNSNSKPGFFSKLFGLSKKETTPDKRPELIMDPTGPVMDYQPDHLDICFCGSEFFFKNCCGSMEEKRPPPYGVFVFENYLSPEIIKELKDHLDKQLSEPLTVIDSELSTPDNIVNKLDDHRKSERVEMGVFYKSVSKIVRTAFIELSEKCIEKKMDWYEPPQILRYNPGGYYNSHADSENMDMETGSWSKVIDRDLSLLIYLNDDFEGGELSFDNFHYTLKPKAGTAVLFPSDHRYKHTAHTVHKGVRQAIVSWGAVHGIKKISNVLPQDAILVEYKT